MKKQKEKIKKNNFFSAQPPEAPHHLVDIKDYLRFRSRELYTHIAIKYCYQPGAFLSFVHSSFSFFFFSFRSLYTLLSNIVTNLLLLQFLIIPFVFSSLSSLYSFLFCPFRPFVSVHSVLLFYFFSCFSFVFLTFFFQLQSLKTPMQLLTRLQLE